LYKLFPGKVNNITVDKCTKFGIVFKVSLYCSRPRGSQLIFHIVLALNFYVFQDVVAAFEVVNCNGVEVQCQVFDVL
jgi:adenylyl cyclase-associated protein